MTVQTDESLPILVGGLLPRVFDLKLSCRTGSCEIKWGIREIKQVEESVRRQLDAACETWSDRTSGKVQVEYELSVTDRPIRVVRKCTVKKPSVAELIGEELYGKATCFTVWVSLPDCVFPALGQQKPYTNHDYMWIPTTERRALDDLDRRKPRDAASHELKHWVKNRMEEIGVRCIPSPDGSKKKQYWPNLREALTPENIRGLNELIRERKGARG